MNTQNQQGFKDYDKIWHMALDIPWLVGWAVLLKTTRQAIKTTLQARQILVDWRTLCFLNSPPLWLNIKLYCALFVCISGVMMNQNSSIVRWSQGVVAPNGKNFSSSSPKDPHLSFHWLFPPRKISPATPLCFKRINSFKLPKWFLQVFFAHLDSIFYNCLATSEIIHHLSAMHLSFNIIRWCF